MISPVALALLVAGMLFQLDAHSYYVTTVADGSWNDAAIWSTGAIPDEAAEIVLAHSVRIPSGTSITILSLSVAGHLILDPGASMYLLAGSGFVLDITGILECADNSTIEGTTTANTIFRAGSRYVHRQGPSGFIPFATWHEESTLQVSGFVDDGYINLAHSASWRQSFGNVEYDCPAQTVFIVDLNGHLRDIRGNLVIRSTNNKALRLSTTQQVTINIGGDLVIEGPTQVWFTTNSANCTVNIGGNFEYRSQGSAASYLATRGSIRLNIGGDFDMDSNSALRMASSAADSTGLRLAVVGASGNFRIRRGSMIAPPPGSGRGIIEFKGSSAQQVGIMPATGAFQGNMEYVIAAGSHVNLGESILSSDQGSLVVSGVMEVGSTDPGGAIQPGTTGGNIRMSGTRTFASGSTIIYTGHLQQGIGLGHPRACHVILDNPAGAALLDDVTIMGNLSVIRGRLQHSDHTITVEGDVTLIEPGTSLSGLVLTGGNNQFIDGHDVQVRRLTLFKPAGSVSLVSGLAVSEEVQIHTPGTLLHANGYLTLLSTSDEAGQTASIGPLPDGAAIVGNVTFQRFMSGERRMYRYISSPVTNASVADLMDDFPVTGTFNNPSVGPGIQSNSPSFYEYDESVGEQRQGWRPYPVAGTAASAPLRPGHGYAAFIRSTSPTVVDLTGPLTQGDMERPLTYTVHQGQSNGWHLVGNPYASAIDWDAPQLSRVNVSNVIAIRDNGAWRYRYWDGDEDPGEIPNGRIAAGQSFWVRATGPAASVTFREGCKAADAAFFRKPVRSIPRLVVSVSGTDIDDRAIVKLRSEASDSLDVWDGVKLLNDTLNIATVSQEGVGLAIDSRPVVPDEIAIRITEFIPGNYILGLSATESFRQYEYTLRDNYLNTENHIDTNDSVSFAVTEDTASVRPDRFTLYLRPSRQSLSILDSTRVKDLVDAGLIVQPTLSRHLPWRFHRFASDSVMAFTEARDIMGINDTGQPVRAYPNPAQDELVIEGYCESNAGNDIQHSPFVDIYNAMGMRLNATDFTIRQLAGSSSLTLNKDTLSRFYLTVPVGTLLPGTYVIRFECRHQVRWLRFVKA